MNICRGLTPAFSCGAEPSARTSADCAVAPRRAQPDAPRAPSAATASLGGAVPARPPRTRSARSRRSTPAPWPRAPTTGGFGQGVVGPAHDLMHRALGPCGAGTGARRHPTEPSATNVATRLPTPARHSIRTAARARSGRRTTLDRAITNTPGPAANSLCTAPPNAQAQLRARNYTGKTVPRREAAERRPSSCS
jgi:hypothetical protein